MIDLHFSPTPNGLKIRLFLEETGLPYRIVPVRLSAGEQFAPAFLTLSPNGKIPAIVDHASEVLMDRNRRREGREKPCRGLLHRVRDDPPTMT